MVSVTPLVAFFVACLALAPGVAEAQELEPRAYVNTPVGLNFIAVAYLFSSGNILLDPSLPIEDLQAKLHLVVVVPSGTLRS